MWASWRTLTLCLYTTVAALAWEGRSEDVVRTPGQVRPAVAAGAFYAGTAAALRAEVQALLATAPVADRSAAVVAAVAPHAGYRYSGAIAARTWSYLADLDVDTIVIIGHDTQAPGVVAFVDTVDDFETPLGRVAVDREMAERLIAYDPAIHADHAMHAREHSIEVQLPFLQVSGRRSRIVPILFGEPTPDHCRRLARAIDAVAGDRSVFVLASSDLSHYPSYADGPGVDRGSLEAITSLNVDTFLERLHEQDRSPGVKNLQTAMCARGGIGTAIAFATAHGAVRARILASANSGDAPGSDRTRVVGYGAVVFLAAPRDPP